MKKIWQLVVISLFTIARSLFLCLLGTPENPQEGFFMCDVEPSLNVRARGAKGRRSESEM
jgi:hypothetical protein